MEAINSTLGMKIPRNYFDLSQIHGFTCKAGYIYPIFQEILMPGDLIKVRSEAVIRQMPTISPSYSRFKVKFWDFVVAIRNLDKNIYRFMSGFKEYTSEQEWKELLPRWTPSDINKTRPGTLWDFLQNPINCLPDEKSKQLDYFRQAYGYIWDVYFRNEARQDSILNEDREPGSWAGEDLLRVNWDRDYFTTSLPRQQMGDPSAIPLVGIGSAVWETGIDKSIYPDSLFKKGTNAFAGDLYVGTRDDTGTVPYPLGIQHITASAGGDFFIGEKEGTNANDYKAKGINITKEELNNNKIDFGTAGTILISQIREMIALQCMSEINAIAGIRDDEFLEANWGERPSNDALQYPDIFGKEVASIITSEVLQTSQTTDSSALGEMGGHGLAVKEGGQHKYYAKEFCIYMKLMYIKPETLYGKQGAKRKFTQFEKYDFPFPQLNHISMQPIYARELLCASTKIPVYHSSGIEAGVEDSTAETWNNTVIGFVPNFQWYKENQNIISGLLNQEQLYKTNSLNAEIHYNENLSNWTEARFFDIRHGYRPVINDGFLKCEPDTRNYNVTDEDQFIVWHHNIVDAWRSMSLKGLPSSLGMIGL